MTNIAGAERRLVAIFAADVEGYSRLMENDEVAMFKIFIFVALLT